MSVDTSCMTALYFILTLLAVVAFLAAAYLSRVFADNPRPAISPLTLVAVGLGLWALVDVIRLAARL